MKIKIVPSLTMIIALVCCQQGVHAGDLASPAKSQEAIASTVAAKATLRFDAFLSRLENCRTRLGKWHSVVKPALKELGYQSKEVDQIWNALRDNKVTLENSTLFCARWKSVHAETLDADKLLALLAGKLPKETTSETTIVSVR
jgi:hypothetical protein